MQLNPQQQRAVEHVDGPLLIIAWAGSGKTATLTERIAYMINQKDVEPSSILALTFTNKAAREMKERTAVATWMNYHPHMRQNRHLPYMGTFHSFWVFVLRDLVDTDMLDISQEDMHNLLLLRKDFIIYDESDKLAVMKDIIKNDLGLIEKEYPPRQIAYYISDAKNAWLSAEDYAYRIDNNLKEVVAQVYKKYEERLTANNALDFDDILVKLLRAFKDARILKYYQDVYTYIMIDEYQDTNTLQYEIIKLLAQKHQNIAVVWDDWQSIYSWRGADMRNILSFENDYPQAVVIKLEQNYRSTKKIIAAANHVVKQNQEALKKELWTENSEGESIKYYEAVSDTAESWFIAKNISEYMEKSPSVPLNKGEANKSEQGDCRRYSDNLILYRTNAQSRSIEEALIKASIPYKVVGGMKFYERKEIKDILAYLRVISNPSDPVSFKRIINTPTRKIWGKTLEILDEYREKFSIWYFQALQNIEEIPEIRPQARVALSDFYTMMSELSTLSKQISVAELIGNIIRLTGYEEYLQSQFSNDEFLSKQENLEELQNIASEYSWLEPRESLSLFLEEVALLTDIDTKNTQNEDVVTLMTIHSAKWLEEKRVLIVGLEDGIFPHSRTLAQPRSLEEERRLMYVAMTRACEELFLTRAKERYYFGEYIRNPESRFIKEIPEEYLESVHSWASFSFDTSFSWWFTDTIRIARKPVQENNVADFRSGDQVEHHKFWVGIIDSLIGELAEVRFRDGVKKMNIRIAPVKKVV